MIGDITDKCGALLLRTKNDVGVASQQPYILVVEDEDTSDISYDIIVEKIHLVRDLTDLQTTIATYIHLVFLLNMNYPKGADTLADVLQRKFARFGSEEGTRTNKTLKTASKNIW